MLTLTNGKYEEFFDDEDVQQIGTALVNIRTNKIVKLLSKEDAEKRLDNTTGKRFLSVDPLTKKYPELTPYQFASNTPISAIDLDGLEATISTEKNTYFVSLKNIHFRFVQRKSTEYFTQATKDFPRHDFSINTQMFDYKKVFGIIRRQFLLSPMGTIPHRDKTLLTEWCLSGRSADKTFHIAHNKDGSWSTGFGDVPKDATFGIGGGTPVVINGLNFGAENVFTDQARLGTTTVLCEEDNHRHAAPDFPEEGRGTSCRCEGATRNNLV